MAIVFERAQPEFPGLLAESPRPMRPGQAGVFAAPGPTRVRLRGRLFYLVGLDTASSVGDRARAELRRFLEQLAVE